VNKNPKYPITLLIMSITYVSIILLQFSQIDSSIIAQSYFNINIKSAFDANGNQISNGATVSPTTSNGNPNSLTFVVDFSGQVKQCNNGCHYSWTNKDCYIDNELLARSDPNNPCADPSWSNNFPSNFEAKTRPLILSGSLATGSHSFSIIGTESNTGTVTSNIWNWNSGVQKNPSPGPCPQGQVQNFPGHCIPAPKCKNGQSYDPQAHRCKFLE
jgi:hypothetical protein